MCLSVNGERMNNEISPMLIELVEVQAIASDARIEMSEIAFQRANDLRALHKKWEESGPHAAEWTKELRERTQAAQVVLAKAANLIRGTQVTGRERNRELLASAKELARSPGEGPISLMTAMLASYRREVDVVLPPIAELFNELDRQVSEIDQFVASCIGPDSEVHFTKWFGRNKSGR
jgi:hypothetical protein